MHDNENKILQLCELYQKIETCGVIQCRAAELRMHFTARYENINI